ncbi:HlyD family secretion protein [Ravibacter arvi]|uniref:HlyD family secretion protein n=1 Tax=Ravibacter arvi TaxID=2051041 RepID=A0ABP8M6B4_9BACT
MEHKEKENGKSKSSLRFALVFGLLVLVGGTFGWIKYRHAQHHEETDDAQVESNISPVIPRVSGYIREVRVSDNQLVKKGDTLLIIDDRDLKIRVLEAQAALSAAENNVSVANAGLPVVRANVSTSESAINTIDAQIEAAKVTQWRAESDFKRFENLVKDHSITQQQYEQALAAKQSADRQLEILKAQKQNAIKQTAAVATQRNVTSRQVAYAHAAVQQREAEVQATQLNLSYTVITAPVDGQVSKINLQIGQFLQAGQSLFQIVPQDRKWVVANFKETQLTKMKAGQKVTIKVDAYPEHTFEGTVSSISPATGSKFSLLPPDNASGNFVKVVQRLPVKIDFSNPKDDYLNNLRAGMNAVVEVQL